MVADLVMIKIKKVVWVTYIVIVIQQYLKWNFTQTPSI